MDSLVVWRGGEGAGQEGAIVFYGILLIRAYDFLGFLSVFLFFLCFLFAFGSHFYYTLQLNC